MAPAPAAGYLAAYPQTSATALPPPPGFAQPAAPAAYGQLPGPFDFPAAPGAADGQLAPALQALLATLANGSRQAADAAAEGAWKLEGRDLKVGRRCAPSVNCILLGLLCCFAPARARCCVLQACAGCVLLGPGARHASSGKAKKSSQRRWGARKWQYPEAEGCRHVKACFSFGVTCCRVAGEICNEGRIKPKSQSRARQQQKCPARNAGSDPLTQRKAAIGAEPFLRARLPHACSEDLCSLCAQIRLAQRLRCLHLCGQPALRHLLLYASAQRCGDAPHHANGAHAERAAVCSA